MDFNLPEEIQILRDTVRRFVDKELIPLERVYRHDSEGPMPEHLLDGFSAEEIGDLIGYLSK